MMWNLAPPLLGDVKRPGVTLYCCRNASGGQTEPRLPTGNPLVKGVGIGAPLLARTASGQTAITIFALFQALAESQPSREHLHRARVIPS